MTFMSKLPRSEVFWSFWLVQFLVLEVIIALVLGYIYTLSTTSGIEEARFPILRTLLLGFLLGLAVHIRWQTPLWRTEVISMLIATIIDLII
jgi:hypothetical protein